MKHPQIVQLTLGDPASKDTDWTAMEDLLAESSSSPISPVGYLLGTNGPDTILAMIVAADGEASVTFSVPTTSIRRTVILLEAEE